MGKRHHFIDKEMSVQKDIIYYINNPFETRSVEYKRNAPWARTTKHRIARAMIAMANLRDGGYIIVGMEQKDDGSFDKVGVTENTYDTYKLDDMKNYLKSHVEPMIKVELEKPEIDGLKFIGIKVAGLYEFPHICTKSEGTNLERGVIYIRSTGAEGCIRLTDLEENKNIIDACAEVQFNKFVDNLKKSGLIEFTEPKSMLDEEKFDKDLSGLI